MENSLRNANANAPPNYFTMIKQLPILFAEVCITTLGVIALVNGIDGAIFISVIGAVAGLGGYAIRTIKPPGEK